MSQNINIAYAASSTLTFTVNSLTGDTNMLIGRQSTVVDNTSNLYLDYFVSGKVQSNGTPPTTGATIELWAFALMDDAPIWPDTFGATDASRTVTNRDILAACAKPIQSILTDATASQFYTFGPQSIRQLFGFVPSKFGLWIVHSMDQTIKSSGSVFYIKPSYETVG